MPTIFLWTAHYNMFWHVIAFLVQCKIEFYFIHEPKNLYFHWWFPPLVKILHLVCIRWNKIQSDCEKIQISSTYYGISRACVNETILMTALQKKKKKKEKKTLKLPKLEMRQAKFCLRVVRWFCSGISHFRPTLWLTRLKMSEIILTPIKPK